MSIKLGYTACTVPKSIAVPKKSENVVDFNLNINSPSELEE